MKVGIIDASAIPITNPIAIHQDDKFCGIDICIVIICNTHITIAGGHIIFSLCVLDEFFMELPPFYLNSTTIDK